MKKTIYPPDSSLASPAKMLHEMFRDLVASRELAWRFAVHDIQAQYRQAFLGILWAFILTLANTLAWIFLNSSGIVKVADTVLPYPVYVFSGTMLWAIFMDALNAPLQQTNAAKAMLSKLKRYVYIWADGVYFNIRSETDRQCILVVIGVTEQRRKKLLPLKMATGSQRKVGLNYY